jgi:predicted transposase/invertase (TIGR01784 family)
MIENISFKERAMSDEKQATNSYVSEVAIPSTDFDLSEHPFPFTNNWMFGRVMKNEEVCKAVVEACTGIKVESISYINDEETVKVDPELRGARFDVIAKDTGMVYDIEIQVSPEPHVLKRMRHYASVLDSSALQEGAKTSELPETFIVFLSKYDLLGLDLPCYTIKQIIEEAPYHDASDGMHKMILNASAWHKRGGELGDLLRYVYTGRVEGNISRQIDKLVVEANEDREWVDAMKSVMTPLEVELTRLDFRVQDAREEGFAEGEARGISIGEARGISIGKAEGKAEGEDRMAKLISALSLHSRTDDIIKVANDSAYRTQLFQEFGI